MFEMRERKSDRKVEKKSAHASKLTADSIAISFQLTMKCKLHQPNRNYVRTQIALFCKQRCYIGEQQQHFITTYR